MVILPSGVILTFTFGGVVSVPTTLSASFEGKTVPDESVTSPFAVMVFFPFRLTSSTGTLISQVPSAFTLTSMPEYSLPLKVIVISALGLLTVPVTLIVPVLGSVSATNSFSLMKLSPPTTSILTNGNGTSSVAI